MPPDRGILTILGAASDVLLSHPELGRRPGVPQAVLVIGAVDGGRSNDAHTDEASPALNLRRLATPVDVAAAKMFHAALQLRNSTARAMAAGADNWFPSQDTLRVAFVLSGAGPGRRVAEAAVGEPYFGRVAASVDGGELELGIAVKLSRLVREKAPSRSLQVRLLEEGVWTAVWDGGSDTDGQPVPSASADESDFDRGDRHQEPPYPFRLNDTALLPLPMPRLPVTTQAFGGDTVRQCPQAIGTTTRESSRWASQLSLKVHAVVDSRNGPEPGSQRQRQKPRSDHSDVLDNFERLDGGQTADGSRHQIRELEQFAVDAERGEEPLLLSLSRLPLSSRDQPSSDNLSKWHQRQRTLLQDGLCAMASSGEQVQQVHVIDANDGQPTEGQRGRGEGLFARVDLRSGFARVGLADVEPFPRFTRNDGTDTGSRSHGGGARAEADEQRGADGAWSDMLGVSSLRGPWAPLVSMRTRTMSMGSVLKLAGWDGNCSTSESRPVDVEDGRDGQRHTDDAEASGETPESRLSDLQGVHTGPHKSSAVASVVAVPSHRWVSWSGAVPAPVRPQLLASLAPFFPAGRPGDMVLNIRSNCSRSLAHYVADRQTVIQIVGEQQLLLLPPAAHRQLRPYPKLHPFAHHSSLTEPQDPTLLNLLHAHGMSVTLTPGDALYIPPFWWTWYQPSVTKAPDASGSSGPENEDEADSSADKQGDRPAGGGAENGDAVIWISTHTADDAVGHVILPLYSREYSFERLRRRLGRLWALRLLIDLVIHRVHGAHSTRGWIERLVSSRYGAPLTPKPVAEFAEITIDDVMKPTKWCADADAPSRWNPAPCSIAVGEPRTIRGSELCQNPYFL